MYRSISEIIDFKLDSILNLTSDEIITNMNSISESLYFDAIKLGTETEENSFEEIFLIRENFPDIKVKVKIGGAGAKNDIKKCFQYKVDAIILPMAESIYAIEHFISHCEYYEKIFNYKIPLVINIETIEAVNKLETFIPLLRNFNSVTIGRSDLSGSIYKDVNSDEVFVLINKIISTVHGTYPDMGISIGGVITPKISKHIYNNFNTDYLNTKFVYIKPDKDIDENIKEALYFEILIYALFYKSGLRNLTDFKTFYSNNIERVNS